MLDEVDLLPIPCAADELQAHVSASRTGRLLHSMRRDGSGLRALVDVLMKLQHLMAAHPAAIASIDVNPLLLLEDGLVAVDALIVTP